MRARTSSPRFALVTTLALVTVSGVACAPSGSTARTNATESASAAPTATATALAVVAPRAHVPGDAERRFARSVVPATAEALTADLTHNVGRRVALTCRVQTIVRADAIVGQCGKEIEPVDIYVLLATPDLRVGERLRVLGEMAPPSQWVDATGHSWFTGMIRARYVERG